MKGSTEIKLIEPSRAFGFESSRVAWWQLFFQCVAILLATAAFVLSSQCARQFTHSFKQLKIN